VAGETPNADDARVRTDALSSGGEDGRGLLRGWCVVCWGACNTPVRNGARFVEGGRDDCGEGGRAENVMEVPGPVDDVRTCVIRDRAPFMCMLCTEVGVGGACAMWAMPFVVRSIETTVVGFVLIDMLLNVFGSDKYDDDEREGDGDGGEVGGSGRMDASSSASSWLDGDHSEPTFPDDLRVEFKSSSEQLPMLLSEISFDNERGPSPRPRVVA